MDPITIAALISIAPSIAGMPWGDIFSGGNNSREGWHGWDQATKEQFCLQGIDAAFRLSMIDEGKGLSPRDLFWQMVSPLIYRPEEKSWQGWFNKNQSWLVPKYIVPAEQLYGFSFYEQAPKSEILKSQVLATLKSPYLIYGGIGLIALWIVSIVLKITKK